MGEPGQGSCGSSGGVASAAAAPRHHPCRCHRHWRHCHRCHRHSCHRCQDPVRHLCPEESLPRKSPLRQTCQGHFQGRWLGRVGAQPNHLWPTTTSTGRIALDIEESMVVIGPLFKPQPWAEPWPGQCRPCQLPFCSYCCTHTGVLLLLLLLLLLILLLSQAARMANYTRFSPSDWSASNIDHYNSADASRCPFHLLLIIIQLLAFTTQRYLTGTSQKG